MLIESINTYNFRNLHNSTLDTDHRHVVLVGSNGQGKSNLLESVYMICFGTSFRTNLYRNIIRFDEGEMSLIARIQNEKNGRHTIKVVIQNGKRRIFLDEDEVKDRKELFDICTCIVFSHEDIDFIKGAPSDQRKFFDQTISLMDTIYLDDLRTYNAIVRQRNAVLKQRNTELLPVYNQKLAETGLRIQQRRAHTVKQFNRLFPDMFSLVSGDDIRPVIVYRPSLKKADTVDEIITILEDNLERDLKYEMTTVGPHRDRYSILNENRDFIATASTGQMRLTALILRSTQAMLYVERTDNRPILLLDDVLLELDLKKRERFLDNLAEYDQAFFTFLPEESYFKEGTYDNISYIVKEGKYTRL